MAERRMLHRKASVSTDLADLRRRHGGDAVAFFHQLIPFYDRWGCVPDDAQKLRAMACPVWDDVTSKVVKGWVEWMVKRGVLVRVSGPSGERGLRNPAFMEHQRGTKFEREAPSLYEPKEITAQWMKAANRKPSLAGDSGPSPDQVPTKSGPSPAKGREGKGINPSPSLTALESAAPAASALAGPKPPAPEVDYTPPSDEEIDAALSPELQAARRRGRVSGKAEQTRREQRAEMDAAALNGAPITEEAARASVEFLRRKAILEGER